jgi:hypothetical protein
MTAEASCVGWVEVPLGSSFCGPGGASSVELATASVEDASTVALVDVAMLVAIAASP